jgi:hypothetical protein
MTEPTSLMDLGVDFETYYDDEYSLKKMENAEYVMDARFEIIGVSIKEPGKPTEFFTGTLDEVHARFARYDWSKIRVVSHNARFDGSILEWRLGFQPAAYLCTMVGSRPHLVPYAGGAGLDDISAYLGLPPKGDYATKVAGLHRDDFSPAQMQEYGAYCIRDTDNATAIGVHLSTILPGDEQYLIDLTLKKYIRPTLSLNKNALLRRLEDLQARRTAREADLFKKHKLTAKDIRSRTKFAKVLGDALGSEELIPKKYNKNNELTYAFAKDDVAFKQLLAHPTEKVRDLVAAKITFSSSIEESRTKKLIELCDVMAGDDGVPWLPVPLVYYGAHTGRLSGDHGINLQNLPRVEYAKDGSLKKGHLRFAVTCPDGYNIVAADLSNIEARIVATLAGQHDLVEAFRQGRDIYSEFASKVYGYPVNKKDHPTERFVGKTCILGLGYGMGYKKFHLKMMQEGVEMTEAEAARIVRLYRETYPEIPKLWRYFEGLAKQYVTVPGGLCPIDKAGLTFAHERIILPNGMPIIYPGLAKVGDQLKFRSRYGSQNLVPESESDTTGGLSGIRDQSVSATSGQAVWGGAFTENIAQALARIILTRAEITLARAGLPASLQVHDELVYRVPTPIAEKVMAAIANVMTRKVDFMPELPVAVEIHHGKSYGDAK